MVGPMPGFPNFSWLETTAVNSNTRYSFSIFALHSIQFSMCMAVLKKRTVCGGEYRVRTCDPLRARQVLSQLSYIPNFLFGGPKWTRTTDLTLIRRAL